MLDWRDEDDVARPLGAERTEYGKLGRIGPANRDFESKQEILEALFGEDAPERVLEVLGVEHAALWRGGVTARRFASGHAHLVRVVALPSAWTLRAATSGLAASMCVAVEWRIVRFGKQVDVNARRTVLPGEAGVLDDPARCR